MPIIPSMPSAEYHSAAGISKSGLDLIARSPAHYRFGAPREPSRAMEIGTAIHTAILEPDRFASEYMLLKGVEDRRSAVYKDAVKTHGSERTLTGPESDRVAAMQESVYANPHAAGFLRDPACQRELSVFTTDPETGVGVKARFDAMLTGRSLDLKKTQDARPDMFAKSVANYRYHVQAAFYSDVWKWETGEELRAFGFLAIEDEAPNATAIYVLDDDALEYGRRLYRRDLHLYAKCLDAGEWPALETKPQVLTLPAWALKGEV
jgi:hypothetical protein